MPVDAIHPAVTFVALLGACVWVGGLVTVVVVARVVRRELDPVARVAFFKALGRSFLPVGSTALTLALVAGMALLSSHLWDSVALTAVALAGALVLAVAFGVAQARGMTRLRKRLLEDPSSASLVVRIRRGVFRAALLRSLIGLLSLGLLALASVLAAQ